MSHGQTWADRHEIPTGEMDSLHRCNGSNIRISDENRATEYEENRKGIETLIAIRDNNYRKKNVNAVVFGVQGRKRTQYAVFVESGFLR